MSLQFTPYLLPVLAAAVLWVGLATYGLRHDDHPGSRAYIVMMLAGAIYSAGYAAQLSLTSLEAKLALWRLQTMAWEFILPALLLFTLSYAGYGWRVDRRLVAALGVMPAVTIVITLLPDTGGLLLRSAKLVTVGGDVYFSTVPGIWYHVGTAYSYVLVTASLAVLVQLLFRVPAAFRAQVATVIAGVSAPVVVDAAFRLNPDLVELVLPEVVGHLPLTFLATGIALTVGRYESDLLRRVPVSFDAVMDAIESGIVVLDGRGRVVASNAAARELLEASDLDGRVLADTSDRAAVVAAVAAGGDPADARDYLRPAGGPPGDDHGDHHLTFDDRVVSVESQPVDGPSGASLGTLLVLRDVTAAVRYDEVLRAHNDQLHLLNQMLRHDIRNDASMALGWAQTVDEELERADVDPAVRDHLRTVIDGTEHVIELTDVAAEMARSFESDGESLRPADLAEALRAEVEDARESHPDAEFRVEGPLPAAQVPANELLGSVFRNLLTNAVVHNDAEAPRVEVSAERAGDRVRVAVADDGPGIPESVRDRLFERGASGEASAGTGLGLYLVSSLVEQFGGDVSVSPNDPQGSVFVVELPVREHASVGGRPAARDPTSGATGSERPSTDPAATASRTNGSAVSGGRSDAPTDAGDDAGSTGDGAGETNTGCED